MTGMQTGGCICGQTFHNKLLLFQGKLPATKETENCNHVDNCCGHFLCLLSSGSSFQFTYVRILSMGFGYFW